MVHSHHDALAQGITDNPADRGGAKVKESLVFCEKGVIEGGQLAFVYIPSLIFEGRREDYQSRIDALQKVNDFFNIIENQVRFWTTDGMIKEERVAKGHMGKE